MTDKCDKYFELLVDQICERVCSGGNLTQDKEAQYVEKFASLWEEMTPEEQDSLEKLIAPKD